MATSKEPELLLRNRNRPLAEGYDSKTTSEEEQAIYDAEIEPCVPPPVKDFQKFCTDHNLSIAFHRKPKTPPDGDVIALRSEALETTLQKRDELRTLAYETYSEPPIQVFFYLRGGQRLFGTDSEGSRINLKDLQREIANLQGVKKFPNIHALKGHAYGRIDPITMARHYKDAIHIFDESVLDGQKIYTNAGMNTWGVCIDNPTALKEALEAEGHKVYVTQITEPEVREDKSWEEAQKERTEGGRDRY